VTPDTSRTLQAPSQIPRTTATFTGPATRARTDQSLSAPDSQQKVSDIPNILTVSRVDFEKLKNQLKHSQRINSEIQIELQETQNRAQSQDIQFKSEITQLTQKEQHAQQKVQEANLEIEKKSGELQLIRLRELDTLDRSRATQIIADQSQADLQTAINRSDLQQQQIIDI